jgi:hypothetical protein
MLKVGLILASPFLIMALVVGATGVVVVDVQEGGEDGTHIVVPVPLVLAQVALTFAPDEAKYVECLELAQYQELAERIVKELEDVPDFTLLEVEDGGENVLIRKVGESLMVDVIDCGEEVHCQVPLKAVNRVLRSYDGRGFSTKSMVWALRSAPRGDLVYVRDGDDVVRIKKL